VYVMDLVCALSLAWALTGVKLRPSPPSAHDTPTHIGPLAGARFIWTRQPLLAAMMLDMLAVVFGGAVILLPIYADQILHIGPAGLGWLRAAPAIGAIAMAFLVAHSRPMARPGLVMLWSVAGFGVAMIVFGLSTSLWLSLLALFLAGACDNI